MGMSGKQPVRMALGLFEYLAMTFGPTNVFAVFQALINDILPEMLSQCVHVYLNYIFSLNF